ncbi:amino acid adenylation domain-containing protein [Streptomyces rubiginosohelvolus]
MFEESERTASPSPLGAAQRGIWYAQRLDPDNPLHSGAAYLELRGPLDTSTLAAAIHRASEDTDALRLAFTEHTGADGTPTRWGDRFPAPDADEGPGQYLDPTLGPALYRPDGPTDRATAERWMRDDLATPADPLTGPLAAQALFQIGGERHLWYYRAHHLLLDGMGLWLFQQRAEAVHTALRTGAPVPENPAAPLGRLWQEEGAYRASPRYAADRAHWQRVMRERPEPASLAGPPTPGSRSFLRSQGLLPAGPADALELLAARHGSGRPAALVAALAALVHRVSGATDIVLGLAVHARFTPAARRTPAMTANVVPLRLTVRPGTLVGDLVEQAARVLRDALRHQRYPREDLARDLSAAGGRRPLHGPTLNIMRAPGDRFDGTAARLRFLSNGPVEDLKFTCYEAGSGALPIDVDADPARYDQATLDRHRERFTDLLTTFAQDPGRPLARLDVRTAAERASHRTAASPTDHRGTDGGDATSPAGAARHPQRPTPTGVLTDDPPAVPDSLPAVFARQAARTPTRIAVTAEDGELSYAELDRRADRLSRLLLARGAGPGRLVALALPRGSVLPVALLAVLRTGAGYLPLDPGYPAARLALTCEEARPVLLVTDTATSALGHLPDGPPRLVLDDPRHVKELRALADTPLSDAERGGRAPAGDDIAYVIHTSGSTGRPKGVMIPHRNVLRLFEAARPALGFGPDDVWTLLHSYAFDFSVWEIWGPLLHGGRLVVVPHDTVRTPALLLRLLERERVTFLNQTPSAFRQLIRTDAERPGLGARLSLRRVVLGGEALDPAILRDWYARHRDDSPLIVNMYGITETTVHVTHLPLTERLASTATGSPIGEPLPGLRLHLLDSALRPSVPGTSGELYVSGSGLAHGYAGRPALTSHRFVADPFGPPGSRMYRTGDLARWTEDGGLAHLGRADGQVQLRGFRVEPAETEAELTRLPSVAAAACVVRGSGDDQRLVAYVVPHASGTPSPADLRAHLARRLPPQSVPGAFVELAELPLTANGKLDRDALPEPTASGTTRAPAGRTQTLLCELFGKVLGTAAPVGADDDFFALGGHSLLATRLVGRIRDALGTELGVGAVFDAPTPSALAELVGREPAHGPTTPTSEAPAHRAAGPAEASDGPVTPDDPRGRVALTSAQRRMWALHRLQGPGPTYNLPCALTLTGALDVEALHTALRDLVRRHEILRTRYPGSGPDSGSDGEPVQEIQPVPAADRLTLARQDSTDADLARDLTSLARAPFALDRDLPFRATLMTLPPAPDGRARHTLLLVLHHIAGDGFSLTPLLDDLSHAYAARRTSREPRWSHPAPSQALHARRERERPPARADIDFWRRTLDGAPEQLPLPTDRPRPAVPSQCGGSIPLTIDAGLHTLLARTARARSASVFMVLHAALAALLTASGAGDDIIVGTPTTGRRGDELDDTVGFFVNPLALRVDTGGTPSFAELLDRVRRTDLAAYDHQDVPFDRVVDAAAPQRSLGRHPLFQVVLSFQNFEPALRLPGIEATPHAVDLGAAKFDLTVNLVERHGEDGTPAGITGDVEYATDLFDAATARAFGQRLLTLLRAAAADPERPLAEIDLATEEERRLATGAWNPPGTPTAHPHFPALFAALAAASPDAPALDCGTARFTYRQLDARTNQLARLLLRDGVRAGSVVPLALPRSAEMTLAWLAVLKTGAACLPVDPFYPAERVRLLLAAATPGTPALTVSAHAPDVGDARAVVSLADPPPAPPLDDTARAVVVLDAPATRRSLDGLPDTPVTDLERARPIDPADPAYVIHTSGSTGRPKGVVVPHAGLPALAEAQADRFRLDPRSRVLQLASPSFDASVMETLMALGTGATLVVPPPGPLAGEELADVLAAHRVTHALIPPTALTGVPPESLPDLRTLVVGGEACPPALAAQWSTGRRMVNAYGPTETTACATTTAPLEPGAGVPIGSPIAGLSVQVLDASLRLAPVGVPGELYIGGPGVAHGYLGRPSLTAERFVADPYGPPGSRAFRTGDRARRRADGTLEHLGRADDQVKIRGFRVEPGEIAAVLGGHPDVRRCAVVDREDRPGDRKLVAYVVPGEGRDVHPSALRQHVQAILPAHMVPAAFVALDALPVTPQGKLDRTALPAPDLTPAPAARAARPGAETALCDGFADILGLSGAGPDDDFFALGGDSVLAIQLVSRLRAKGLTLTTRHIFEHRTPGALAERARPTAPTAPAPGPAREVTDPFAAPPMAHWLRAKGDSARSFSQTMVVPTPPSPDGTHPILALQYVIDSHEALRTTLLSGAPDDSAAQRLRLRSGAPGSLDAADLLERIAPRAAGEADLTPALDRARAALDPERGHMVRAVWADAGPDQGRLALVVHHLAVDAVSWGVLLPDLRRAWEAAAEDRPLAPPPPRAAYAHWAAALAEQAHTPVRVRELPTWTATLGAPHLRPTDRPLLPARDTHATLRHHTVDLPAPTTHALLTRVPVAFHCRVLEPLLTAFGLALTDWARTRGQDPADVLLDMEGHGRDSADPAHPLDSAVGWFTALHPLRLPLADLTGDALAEALAGGPALGDAVKRVKEALRAVPGDGTGYGLLRHLNDRTAPVLAALPAPPFGFNYLGRFRHDDTPFSAAPGTGALAGAGAAPGFPASHALELNAVTLDTPDGPCLRAVWSWPAALLDTPDVVSLGEGWARMLTALVTHAETPDAGGWTPSDLPLVDLDQSEIDALEAVWRGR